jgi:hypothetical protein
VGERKRGGKEKVVPAIVVNLHLRMKFDPVFNPNLHKWKAWGKINGKRPR